MDRQTNRSRSSDVDVDIKEVVQDSSGSSIRSDCISRIKAIRTQNVNVIIGNLNINSLSSKFDDLKVLMTGMFDILVITNKTGQHFSRFTVSYRWVFHTM